MLKRLLAGLSLRFFWEFSSPGFSRKTWQKRIFTQHYWLLKQIKRFKPNSVLEVGCGFGRNLKFLLDRGVAAERLTGVDFSWLMLAQAKGKLPRTVRLIRADAANLPFSDQSFALVFTHGLLMHLEPQKLPQAWRELVRVSRKQLVVIEEVRNKPCRLNHFTWAHDYEKMINDSQLKILAQGQDLTHNLQWYCLNTTTKENSNRKS